MPGKNEKTATIHAGHYSRAPKKQPSLGGRVEIRMLRKRIGYATLITLPAWGPFWPSTISNST
jgi:hypothetical protein